MVERRNIAVAIILTIVTCGIYGIYWYIKLNDDLKTVTGDEFYAGVKNLLLTIVTCGIWGMYWSYKVGKSNMTVQQKSGEEASDSSVLYLVLTLLGWSIVVWGLTQNELNKYADKHAQGQAA